jgi:hypothetical protein
MAGAMMAASPAGGVVEVGWRAIAGGGASGSGASTSAGLSLSATIGQAAIGPSGGSSGGSYTLTGGFWAAAIARAKPACPADLNGDAVVDGADLGLLVASWSLGDQRDQRADLDGDGLVTGADLGVLLGAWGDCP